MELHMKILLKIDTSILLSPISLSFLLLDNKPESAGENCSV